jgi:hypothetical protein
MTRIRGPAPPRRKSPAPTWQWGNRANTNQHHDDGILYRHGTLRVQARIDAPRRRDVGARHGRRP